LRAPFTSRSVQKIIRTVLKSERKSTALEINVVFVDNKKIRALSKKFLGEDHDTDVIAFPYEEGDIFGDIFISLPMAQFNAKRFSVPYKTEVLRLVVHGTLHLLGYSDHGRENKNKMWKKQENIVGKLNKKI
jgi:rRNA maturation RNase YbeY